MKTVNLQIPDKEAFMKECYEIKKIEHSESQLTGLCYFTAEKLQELFKEHIKRWGVKVKIIRGWSHFMGEGADRPSHQHTQMTGLYYLKIPTHSAEMRFDDTGEVLPPVEDDFIMFDPMRPHSISKHNNKELRWAVAFECELIT